jgi:hypothetical protein
MTTCIGFSSPCLIRVDFRCVCDAARLRDGSNFFSSPVPSSELRLRDVGGQSVLWMELKSCRRGQATMGGVWGGVHFGGRSGRWTVIGSPVRFVVRRRSSSFVDVYGGGVSAVMLCSILLALCVLSLSLSLRRLLVLWRVGSVVDLGSGRSLCIGDDPLSSPLVFAASCFCVFVRLSCTCKAKDGCSASFPFFVSFSLSARERSRDM